MQSSFEARLREIEQRVGMLTELDEWLAKIRTQPLRSGTSGGTSLEDLDGDTKVQVEESPDEDKIRMDTGGTERAVLDSTALALTVGKIIPDSTYSNAFFSATSAATTLSLEANNYFIYATATDTWSLILDSTWRFKVTPAAADFNVPLGVAGTLDVSGHAAIGPDASVSNVAGLAIKNYTMTESANFVLQLIGYSTGNGIVQTIGGLTGQAYSKGTPTSATVYGLYYFAGHGTSSTTTALYGVYTRVSSITGGSGAITTAYGLCVDQAYWGASKPATVYGVYVGNQGTAVATTTTTYGQRILGQSSLAATGTTYQLYIDAVTAGSVKYGIYQAGSGDTNIFYGSTQLFHTTASFGGGVGVLGIRNAGTNPSSNPSNGGVMYASAGALYWRGSSGTITKVADA